MIEFLLVVFFLVLSGLLGWLVFTSIFDLFFKKSDSYNYPSPNITYIDKSKHTHQNLTIINKDESAISIENETISTDV